MINKSDASDVKPFTGLSPDLVLDAAASVGLDVDGNGSVDETVPNCLDPRLLICAA